MNYKIINNDCLIALDELEEESIDSIVTDPPYGLTSITKRFGKEDSAPAKYGRDGSFARLSRGFMGKEWDGSGIEYNIEMWQKCLRVLKPGGYLLAFGGSRTFHRIACAIEDAGFEIRDTIMWLYGSGFPKSMNIGLAIDKKNGVESKVIGKQTVPDIRGDAYGTINDKQGGSYKNIVRDIKKATNKWSGWGTALKPSFEPIIVARKPFKGSLVDNVIENGVGGINIDECRVGTEVITQLQKDMTVYHGNNLGAGSNTKMTGITTQTIGRFPANTILTYDETDFDEVCGGFPNTSGGSYRKVTRKRTGFKISGSENNIQEANSPDNYGDSGSASRYFYCAKASKKDRDEGLDEFEEKLWGVSGGSQTAIAKGEEYHKDTIGLNQTKLRKNTHPTVKPTELMQYLVRLVTPKGGTILDPFMGSGSTGKAVMFENKERNAEYKFIGIEKEKEYSEIAEARIKFASEYKEEKEDVNQISFIDFIKGE